MYRSIISRTNLQRV